MARTKINNPAIRQTQTAAADEYLTPENARVAETELLLGHVHSRQDALEKREVASRALGSSLFDGTSRSAQDEERYALLNEVTDAVYAKLRTQLTQDPTIFGAITTNVSSQTGSTLSGEGSAYHFEASPNTGSHPYSGDSIAKSRNKYDCSTAKPYWSDQGSDYRYEPLSTPAMLDDNYVALDIPSRRMSGDSTITSESASPKANKRKRCEPSEEPARLDPSASNRASTASALKRMSLEAKGQTAAGKHLTGEFDPVNIEIKRLRMDENLDFHDIAETINKQRISNGLEPTLNANAVYGRYKRNAPLIAAMNGEQFVPTPKDKQKSGLTFKVVEPITGFDAKEDELLVKAYNDVKDDMWKIVSDRIAMMGGRHHSPVMCSRRYHCL